MYAVCFLKFKTYFRFKHLPTPFTMKKYAALLIAFSVISFFSFAQTNTILGFSSSAAEAQLAAEKKFDASLSAKNIDQLVKELSAEPHHVGSPGDEANAKYILNKF